MSSEITKVSMEPFGLMEVGLVKVGRVRKAENRSNFH